MWLCSFIRKEILQEEARHDPKKKIEREKTSDYYTFLTGKNKRKEEEAIAGKSLNHLICVCMEMEEDLLVIVVA